MINRFLPNYFSQFFSAFGSQLAKVCKWLTVLLIAVAIHEPLQAQNSVIVKINGPQVLCEGQCDSLHAVVMNPGSFSPPYTYSWTGPNGFTASQPTISICAGGTYTVVVSSANDLTASASYNVFVLPYQPLKIISSNTAPCNHDSTANVCEKICPYTTVTYSVDPINSTAPILIWQVNGAISYSTNNPPFNNSITVHWGGTGSGLVSVHTEGGGIGTPAGGGCSGEDALCVTIIDSPQAAFIADPAPNAGLITVCKGQTVYFDNQSSGADFYEWAFSDDLSTTSATDPPHVFQNAGNYMVRLIARSSCLCADTVFQNVEVLDAIAPALSCVGTICPNETVTYEATNACAPYVWLVSPNGTVLAGGTASADSITIQWANGPAGTITLGAQPCTGAVCPEPAVIHVPIISDDAEIQGKARVCPSSEEGYSIEPYGGTGFLWSLSGGGNITDGQGTNHVTISWTAYPNSSTTYWLSVKYDNCYLGCGGEDSFAVHILSPFILNGPVELCTGANSAFSSKLTTPVVNLPANWTLTGPNGSTIWTSPTASANVNAAFTGAAGVYRLLAIPADPTQTCSDEATWTVSVPAAPDKPTGISGPVFICPNNTYTYEALGGTVNNNLQWTVRNGAATIMQTGNPLNVSWGGSGPYSLSARQVSTNGLGCLSDTVRLNVFANSNPSISGDDIVCEDARGFYTIANAEAIDIQWSINPVTAGAIASGQGTSTVEIFWTEAGGHALSAAVCGQPVIFPVTVLAQPTPMVQAPATVCVGQTKIVQTVNPYTDYLWRAADGSTLATTPTTNLGNGSYSVQVTNGQGCVGTAEFTINASPNPNLNITTGDFTAFCNNANLVTINALSTADGDFQYQWFQNGLPVGGNTPSYTTNQYGLYTATVTNAFACTASDGPIAIVDDCGAGGGGGSLPGGGLPPCQQGDVQLVIMPTTVCDSFNFQVLGPQYLPGSATWYFAESGAALLSTSNEDSPGFHFQNAGQFLVVLHAQLLSGAICLLVDSVKVAASAQFSLVTACPGAASNFQDVSTYLPGGGISGWAWNFGDPSSGAANTSILRNSSHAYSNSGNYPVVLTITANSGCTASATQIVQIPTASSPVFAPPTQNCAGNALAFAATIGQEVSSLVWDFGQPASGPANDASGSPVYHSFNPGGSYTVTATATNAYGCTAGFSQNVLVTPNNLTGSITPANPGPICEGGSITFTAPPGGISWVWSDSSSTQSIVVQQEGTYRVTVTNTNGCTYSPPPVRVEVNPSPDALIKALLENSLGQVIGTVYPTLVTCAGEDVHLMVQGNGASYGYVWSGGNGSDDEVFFTDTRHNLLSVGDHFYTVTVTDFANGCTAVTDPFVVTVNPVPSGFNIAANGICAQAATTLSYNGPNPANWQLVWSNGQGGPTLSAEDPGLYFIRVINEFGCEAKSNNVFIQPGPPVASIPGGCHRRCRPDTLCLPTTLPNIASWQWYFEGQPITGATGPDLVATQSGAYWAVLTDGYGCMGQSDPLMLDLFDAFGNVSGSVWSDVNNNGLIDPLDTLLSGIPVNLYQNGTSVGAVQSNNAGQFAFTNVLSTNYLIQLDTANLPPNWQVVIGQEPVNMSGCQTAASADLLLKFVCPTLSSSLQIAACPGGSVLYQSATIQVGQSQNFLFITPQGCDSTVTVNAVALAPSASALTLKTCPGSTVNYSGMLLAPGAVQNFIFQNYQGCDSTVTVTVEARPVSASALTLMTCPNTPAFYAGMQLAAGTVQEVVLQNYVGCDSTVTVTVQALPVSVSSLTLQGCPGSSVEYNGQQLMPGTVQDVVLQNYLGCDSTVTVTVQQLPTSVSNLTLQGCPGSTVGYNGQQLLPGTVQEVVLQNYLGCDSTVVVTVALLQNSTADLQVSVCPNETYNYAGVDIPVGQSQAFHLVNSEGCDSLLTISVSAFPVASFTITADSSCVSQATGSLSLQSISGGLAPYQYSLNGGSVQSDSIFQNLASGEYEVLLEDANGCAVYQNARVGERPRLELVLQDGILPCDSTGVLLAPLLSGDTAGLQFKWWNGSLLPVATATVAGMVWLEATNQCETVHRDAEVVWAEPGADISLVYVPNVIAPAARDYENAIFRPSFSAGLAVQRYYLEVFDRWGNLLFRSSSPESGWTGNFQDRTMKPGVYVWYLEADVNFCGRTVTLRKKGDVTIVR